MGIKQTQELKHLETRLAKATADWEAAKVDVRQAQRREAELARAKTDLQRKIEAVKEASAEPIVSEHALLRYFERVMGFDLEEIKRQMLTDQAKAMICQFGSGKIPGGGCRLVVQNRVVVTVENQQKGLKQ